MDYEKIYANLINRAKNRELQGYVEKHHIVPKCLGGDDSVENLAILTPEEHYLAHQLLVKMHPDHEGLTWAALQMTGRPISEQRTNNKVYGWLRRKHSENSKRRVGEKNGSYGKRWFYNPDTLENIKCDPQGKPIGFIAGRIIKKEKKKTYCLDCGKEVEKPRAKYCDFHRKRRMKKVDWGKSKRKKTDLDIKKALTSNNYDVTMAMKSLGYSEKSCEGGNTRYRFKKILSEILQTDK